MISSGEADSGLYVHGNRVGHHLKDLNRFFQTTVHTICYGDTEWDRSHVEAVAKPTGGTFKAVEGGHTRTADDFRVGLSF